MSCNIMNENQTIFHKYRKEIRDILNVDETVLYMVEDEYKRLCERSTTSRHPSLMSRHLFFFYSLLAIVTNLLFPILGLKRRVHSSEFDFVFISCPDPVFRTKNIDMLAGTLKYCIIYLPNFHLSASIRYHKYFKEIGVMTVFPTISLRQVLYTWIKMRKFKRKCRLATGDLEEKKLISTLSRFLLYDELTKKFISDLDSFSGSWILEHQIYYFLNTIVHLREQGKESTMLQHGLFFKPTTDFFPLHCDKVLCCSEREKNIYIKEGIDSNRVKVLGIPLQTISRENFKQSSRTEYQLLILLTLVNKNNAPKIGEILTFVRQHFDSVLLRFRPRSKESDKRLLEKYIANFDISEGKTIGDDLQRSQKVVTFSADAIVEVVKFNKPFVYIWLKEYQDFVKKNQCATMGDYKNYLQTLKDENSYTNTMKEMSNYIVGEQRIEILNERFVSFVESKSVLHPKNFD